MYFLNEDERRYLIKGLIPKSRSMDVAEELRGWNWHHPPIEPAHDVALGVWEVAGRYCPTARDLYLRRVMGLRPPASSAMQAGQLFHAVVVEVLTRAKQLLYAHGPERYHGVPDALAKPDLAPLFERVFSGRAGGSSGAPSGDGTAPKRGAEDGALREQAERLWQFEARRVSARIEEVLSRHPHIGVDALVSLAIPVVLEQKLDGRCLGLSAHLSVDGLIMGEPLVVDLKFGEPRDFHVLTLTGYALAMEAIYEYPVNLGCLVYTSYEDGRWVVQRQFHLLGEKVRQWFLDERDEKQRIVFEEFDPGMPDSCPRWCAFWSHCHGDGGPAG